MYDRYLDDMSYYKKFVRRRSFLLGLSSLTAIGAVAASRAYEQDRRVQILDDPNRDFTVSDSLSLKQRAANKGIIYGAASRKISLLKDKQYASAIVENCGLLVPEWEFKWTAGNVTLRPDAEEFDFTAADWMANFAAKHNLLLRGHTLVWHESLPRWFKETVNRKNAEYLLKNHIQTLVGRYAGKIHSWDVVNEAIDPQDNRGDGLRISPWLETLGDNYINLAFRLTAETDPQSLLVYNDYGLDYDDREQEAKRTATLRLLERLKSQGTPIHALGIQAHLSPGARQFNPEKLRKFLEDVASLGLKIMITELDVKDKSLPKDREIRDRIIAGVYEDYLSTVLDERAVIAVINWGLSDRYTWLSEYAPRPDGLPVRPLPLDDRLQPKLAWNAIARAFDRAPKR
jgi:endo-1,4-beta-xylanase